MVQQRVVVSRRKHWQLFSNTVEFISMSAAAECSTVNHWRWFPWAASPSRRSSERAFPASPASPAAMASSNAPPAPSVRWGHDHIRRLEQVRDVLAVAKQRYVAAQPLLIDELIELIRQ